MRTNLIFIFILNLFVFGCGQSNEDILKSTTWKVVEQPNGWKWELLQFFDNDMLKLVKAKKNWEASWRILENNSIQFVGGLIVEFKIINIQNDKLEFDVPNSFGGGKGIMLLIPTAEKIE